jgi:hypothetical protein
VWATRGRLDGALAVICQQEQGGARPYLASALPLAGSMFVGVLSSQHCTCWTRGMAPSVAWVPQTPPQIAINISRGGRHSRHSRRSNKELPCCAVLRAVLCRAKRCAVP